MRLALLAGLLGAGGALGADAPRPVLQTTMLAKVNPGALALWDITNKAMDDTGVPDPKKISADTWAKLQDFGRMLEEGGKTLATPGGVTAAPAGAKLQDENNPGASKAADVQRYLDAQPAQFRKHAQELEKVGASIVAAASRHDAKTLGALSDSLDEVCEGCHATFWYPQQHK